ncbi:MAG: hypothetical protein H7199_05555 [Burkholderiales bacterium]|nr:hypothetical protein [Flavobacterium sp.]
MKIVISSLLVGLMLACCSTFSALNSNTSIKPNDSFLLGNNEHGKFHVKLKNMSNHAIDIYLAPITGGTYSRQTVQVNQEITTSVEKNTAMVIENKSAEYASVDLKVTGDLGLAMTYKN